MNNSHSNNNIPAHRVVNRNGMLTGKHHFSGTNLMKELLENEGIKIVDNVILDFEKFFWVCSQSSLSQHINHGWHPSAVQIF